MTLIYYDNYPVDHLAKLTKILKEKINDEVLFIPKGFDVLLNASEDQLISAKNTIEAALKLKEIT